jgi:hypothetical protein
MSHLRPKLYLYARVCRTDDPRHVGIVLQMFKWKRHDEWIAVQWIGSRWCEYVPMAMLVHAEE